MTPEQWRRLEQLFMVVVELPPEDRIAYIDEHCRDDAEIRAALIGLCFCDDSPDKRLESTTPIAALLLDELLSADQSLPIDAVAGLRVGTIVGPYIIDIELGSGGMGVVYRATDTRLDRVVALKLLTFPFDPVVSSTQFVNETRIAAKLQHPGIVVLYEAGTWTLPESHGYETVRGYSMQYVADAEPVTDYADSRDLGWRDRLTLFIKICRAVEFASASSVVHRDLKPHNILVTRDGEPHVIDFGLALLLDTHHKHSQDPFFEAIVGSLPYMSPEHIDRGAGPLGIRSDVYSLGVILFELLTGELPIPLDEHSTLLEALEAKHRAPPSLRTLNTSLPRDIDWVAAKALAPLRTRYESPGLLGDDIQRVLDGYVPTAGTPSHSYRTYRFIRRHLLASTFVGAALAALPLFAFLYVIARSERELANDRLDASTRQAIEVSNSILSRVQDFPASSTLRADILTANARLLSDLRTESDDSLLGLQARMLQHALQGELTLDSQGPRPALAELQLAVELSELRRLRSPGDSSAYVDAALALQRMADALHADLQLQAAKATYSRALSLVRLAPTTDPRAALLRQVEAAMLIRLSDVALSCNDPQDARTLLAQSLTTLVELVQANPTDSDIRYDFAAAHARAGRAELSIGSTRAAYAHAQHALELFERFQQEGDRTRRTQTGLAMCHSMLADVAQEEGDSHQAVEFYARAHGALTALWRRDGQDIDVGGKLMSVLARSASAHFGIGATDEAYKDLQAAESLYSQLIRVAPDDVRLELSSISQLETLSGIASARGEFSDAEEYLLIGIKRLSTVVAARDAATELEGIIGGFWLQGARAAQARADWVATEAWTHAALMSEGPSERRERDSLEWAVHTLDCFTQLSLVDYYAYGNCQAARRDAEQACELALAVEQSVSSPSDTIGLCRTYLMMATTVRCAEPPSSSSFYYLRAYATLDRVLLVYRDSRLPEVWLDMTYQTARVAIDAGDDSTASHILNMLLDATDCAHFPSVSPSVFLQDRLLTRLELIRVLGRLGNDAVPHIAALRSDFDQLRLITDADSNPDLKEVRELIHSTESK